MFKGVLLSLLLGICLKNVLGLDVCNDQGNYSILVHPADCSKYIVCRNGSTSDIRQCTDGKHFNRLTSTCDTPIEAACDVTLVKQSWAESVDCNVCQSVCGCYPKMDCPPPATPSPETPAPETPSPETPATPSPETPTPATPSPATPCPAPGTPTPGTPTPATPSPETPGTPTPAAPSPETPTVVTPRPETSSTPQPNCTNNLDICVGKPDNSNVYLPGTCQKYAICISGCATVLTCPNNLIYNLITRACDYPQNVSCPYPVNPPSGPSAGPSGTKCEQHGKCEGQRDGTLFPDSNSNGYIICQCECEIARPCPASLVFNAKLQVCDY